MSNISSVMDAVEARVAAVYTSGLGYKRIQAFDLEKNDEQNLVQGVGWTVDDNENLDRFMTKKTALAHLFTIYCTRENPVNDFCSNPSGWVDIQKTLKEDAFLMISDIGVDPHLGTSGSGGPIVRGLWRNTGPIQSVFQDKIDFLFVPVTILVEYHETDL